MIKTIQLNLMEIESMLYFWQATNDREKVAEAYLYEVAAMPGLTASYDDEFDAESVRKVLSAITNKELLSSKTQKEGRFWNYNMWMMEDLSYTDSIIRPLKMLNIDDLTLALNHHESKYEDIAVIISPLSVEDYIIKENKLIINFFRIRPLEEKLVIEDKEIKNFIQEKLLELLG